MKSQQVRLVDVFVLGPLLAWAGWEKSTLPTWMRAFLFVSGVATVWYNGRNYLEVERRLNGLLAVKGHRAVS